MNQIKKMKKKTKTRKQKGGLFNYVDEEESNVIHLTATKYGALHPWNAVYLPFMDQIQNSGPNSQPITPEFVVNRINVIYNFLTRENVFLTKCSFNKIIMDRINSIKSKTDSFYQNQNVKELHSNLMEMQLYVMVCRNQTMNRAAWLNFFGTVLKNS